MKSNRDNGAARILIVEDSIVLGHDLVHRIDKLGYEPVALLDSGEAAIDRAERERPDLILMDINLAGEIDGIEAAEKIRAEHEIPVIFVTADTDDEHLERAKLTQPFGYLLKPVEDSDLRASIEIALYATKIDRERRRAEEERLALLRFFESMDQVNSSIRSATDLEQMMDHALAAVLDIFGVDRAWLMFPCDTTSPSWSVPMERTRADYPGAFKLGAELPNVPENRRVNAAALAADGPVTFDPESEHAPPRMVAEKFGVKSLMVMAVAPRLGKPWLFGVHQCSFARVWSQEDVRLFREIGHRIGDGLSTLLYFRNLQESEQWFRYLFDSTPGALILTDPEGGVTRISKAGMELFGLGDLYQVRGRDIFVDLRVPEAVRRQVRSGLDVRFESAFGPEHAGGEGLVAAGAQQALVLDVNIVPVYGLGSTQLRGFLCHCADITQRKHAEEERLRLERQLFHAQKMESLGVLSGGIAHDFNNLLVGVLGYADIALSKLDESSGVRHELESIQNASKRAADLASQMLAYSGKGRFSIEPVDLSAVVEEMTHLLEVSTARNAELRFELASPLPSVEADVTQVRQVVMNLVTNAAEAVGEGGGVITVSTGVMECDEAYLQECAPGSVPPEGRYVFIEVADSGSGMDELTRARVFEPFFSTKFTGRGLGMAAVQGIVRGHEGAIRLATAPGEGTTVRVLLPASALPAAQLVAMSEPVEEWQGSGTVLLVDDEEVVRDVAAEMVEMLGFSVITARDGCEAVELFAQHANEITLVILDMKMPHMNGETAFEKIRNISDDARVILSSGYPEEEATERFVGRGLAGFIQKPYQLSGLRNTIREVLTAAQM